MAALLMSEAERERRAGVIDRHLQAFGQADDVTQQADEHRQLEALRMYILALIAEGDEIAARLRAKTGAQR